MREINKGRIKLKGNSTPSTSSNTAYKNVFSDAGVQAELQLPLSEVIASGWFIIE